MFNHKRLSLARMRRRLTGKALAERAGLSAVTISRLENGENPPDEGTVERLSKALSFPVEFFHGDDPQEIDTGAVSFRSFSRMTARERDAATSAGSLGLDLSDWVNQRFALPRPNLLDLSYETNPEAAARSLRQFWALGERPIGHLLGLLETHGVRVFSLSENTAAVNAFSFWRNEIPFIFLNNFKTAESSIFDSAHELAHLVLHKHAGPRASRDAEREANLFASAFLMPAEDVRARMPRYISVSVVLQAKKRWRVSAMAMAYRLNTLGLLTERQYKLICIELGRRGYRASEPDGIEREGSVVWNKVFSQLWAERTTKNAVADSLYLPLDELEGLVWGLAAGRKPAPPKTSGSKLRAIK
jgi:Zn-dependent peptidase ImmA (M78 family)/DNA-binding XRE family transcriptional regulator